MLMPQLQKCVSDFTEHVFSELGDDAYYWIAGGAVRDYFIFNTINFSNDIDIFFPDHQSFKIVKNNLLKNGYEAHYESENALKLLKDNKLFDLVKIYYQNPQKTIEDFDFTVCCAAVSYEGFSNHHSFFIDLSSRNIVINNINHPFKSLIRVNKYIKKGFKINDNELIRLISAIKLVSDNEIPEEFKFEMRKLSQKGIFNRPRRQNQDYVLPLWEDRVTNNSVCTSEDIDFDTHLDTLRPIAIARRDNIQRRESVQHGMLSSSEREARQINQSHVTDYNQSR